MQHSSKGYGISELESEEQALFNQILAIGKDTDDPEKDYYRMERKKDVGEGHKYGKHDGKERKFDDVGFKKKPKGGESEVNVIPEQVSNNWKIVSNAITKTEGNKIKSPINNTHKSRQQNEGQKQRIVNNSTASKFKQCALSTVVPRIKNQLHKKLNIFDEGADHKNIAITRLYSLTTFSLDANDHAKNNIQQAPTTPTKIIYLNTFTIFHYQKSSLLSSLSQASSAQQQSNNTNNTNINTNAKSQLHFHSFCYNPTEYLVTQSEDLTIWIGKITNKCEYRLLRKIYLGDQHQDQGQNQDQHQQKRGAKVTVMCYIPVLMNKYDHVNYTVNGSENINKQSKNTTNRTNIILEKDRLAGDKLLIGCQNGIVYVIDKLSQIIQKQNYNNNNNSNNNDTIIHEQNMIKTPQIPTKYHSNQNKQIHPINNNNLPKLSNIVQYNNNQISSIIQDTNKIDRIHIIVNNNKIYTYDYQRIKQLKQFQVFNKYSQIIRPSLTLTLTLAQSILHRYHYTFIHTDPSSQLNHGHQQQNPTILCIKNIQIKCNNNRNDGSNAQRNGNGMLIYLQNMQIPCILSEKQISIWFPMRVKELGMVFNRFWTNAHYAEYLDSLHEDYGDGLVNNDGSKFENQQKNNNKNNKCDRKISVIQYNLSSNQVIIGYKDGIIQFYSVVPTINYVSAHNHNNNSTNSQQNSVSYSTKTNNQQYNLFPELSSSQVQLSFISKPFKQQSQRNLSINTNTNNNAKNTPIFTYILQKHFVIKQDNSINSLSTHRIQPYICIATDMKILFYDIEYRRKFSQSLKQKHANAINLVRWTVNNCLLLCSTSQSQPQSQSTTTWKLKVSQQVSVAEKIFNIENDKQLINSNQQVMSKITGKNKVSEDKVYLYSKEIPIRAKQ